MQKLIIDTDPGVDDAHAILLALAHPDVTVEAITTVNGNVSLEHTTTNALKILDAAGVDVPVFAGCAAPLISVPSYASYVHGTDGLGDCGFPPSSRKVEQEHASIRLVQLANQNPGEITLVAIGPLTNIAVALRLDPDLPQKIKRLVIMGGAHYSQGNTANVTAEFNFFTDPEAAAMVLAAWPKAVLLTWETTLAHMITAADLAAIHRLNTEKSRFFEKTSQALREFICENYGEEVLFEPDGLAMAIAIEPGIVKKSEERYVTIELAGQYTRGQMCVDWNGMGKKSPNAEIVLEIDQQRFVEMLVDGLR